MFWEEYWQALEKLQSNSHTLEVFKPSFKFSSSQINTRWCGDQCTGCSNDVSLVKLVMFKMFICDWLGILG